MLISPKLFSFLAPRQNRMYNDTERWLHWHVTIENQCLCLWPVLWNVMVWNTTLCNKTQGTWVYLWDGLVKLQQVFVGLRDEVWGRLPESTHFLSQAQGSVSSSECGIRCESTILPSLWGKKWWKGVFQRKKEKEIKTNREKDEDKHTHAH